MSAHTVTPHTFSVAFTADNPWTETDTYTATSCQCGIASGATYTTLEAVLRTQMHICRSTRTFPVWDGTIVTV